MHIIIQENHELHFAVQENLITRYVTLFTSHSL